MPGAVPLADAEPGAEVKAEGFDLLGKESQAIQSSSRTDGRRLGAQLQRGREPAASIRRLPEAGAVADEDAAGPASGPARQSRTSLKILLLTSVRSTRELEWDDSAIYGMCLGLLVQSISCL